MSKMLRPAYEHNKLQRPPVVKKLREADPRAGFVTREQFTAMRKALPEELKTAATVAYTFGWRKRKVLDLKRHQYNAQDGTLRLTPAPRRTAGAAWSESPGRCRRCSTPRSAPCEHWSARTVA